MATWSPQTEACGVGLSLDPCIGPFGSLPRPLASAPTNCPNARHLERQPRCHLLESVPSGALDLNGVRSGGW
jgi:hypothetical protein